MIKKIMLISSILLSNASFSNDKELNEDDLSKAQEKFQIMKKEAAQGNVEYQAALCVLSFESAITGSIKPDDTFNWCKQSADAGDVVSKYHLAIMYDFSVGVEKSNKKAIELYKEALVLDSPNVKYRLAIKYLQGDGVLQDFKKAHDLMKQAAFAGLLEAQFDLGAIYLNGYGIEINFKEAYAWMSLAALNGSVDAKEIRNKIAEILNTKDLLDAQERSIELNSKISK